MRRKDLIIAKMQHALRANRFRLLLITQLVMIVGSPFLVDTQWAAWFSGGFLLLIMISMVYTLIENHFIFILACIQAIIIFIAYAYYLWDGSQTAYLTEVSLNLLFYLFAIFLVFGKVLKSDEAVTQTIFASLSVYVMIGITFSLVYTLINTYSPGAFYFTHSLISTEILNQFQLLYFSFSTLTTVGYGDIVAVTPQARSIVMLEQVTGVLYLAVLVSRIIASLKQES